MAHEVPVTQARAEFAELVNRVVYGGERIVVTRHGRPLVALVSAADLDRLERADEAEAGLDDVVVRLPIEPPNQQLAPPPPAAQRYDVAAQHRPPGRFGPPGGSSGGRGRPDLH